MTSQTNQLMAPKRHQNDGACSCLRTAVSSYAKERNGQAMARLLNVADGVVGQGLRVLFCLTTNEDLRALHPELVRPGRCCVSLQIGRFTEAEANSWLQETWSNHQRTDERPTVHGERSLAELVALCHQSSPMDNATPAPATGLYL